MLCLALIVMHANAIIITIFILSLFCFADTTFPTVCKDNLQRLANKCGNNDFEVSCG